RRSPASGRSVGHRADLPGRRLGPLRVQPGRLPGNLGPSPQSALDRPVAVLAARAVGPGRRRSGALPRGRSVALPEPVGRRLLLPVAKRHRDAPGSAPGAEGRHVRHLRHRPPAGPSPRPGAGVLAGLGPPPFLTAEVWTAGNRSSIIRSPSYYRNRMGG